MMALESLMRYAQWVYAMILRTNYVDLIKDLAIFSLVIVSFRVIEFIVQFFSKRVRSEWFHHVLESPMGHVLPFLRALILYLTCKELQFTYWLDRPISFGLWFLIFFRGCSLAVSLLVGLLKRLIRRNYKAAEEDLIGPITMIVKIVVWSVGAVLALDNLNFNITALVTGLGVGGLAIAFASQKVLGDIFNFFVLTLDVPFQVGDTIRAGDQVGTVEYVGIKTTHVRSVSGELLVMPNSSLTSICLQNFKRMSRRRSFLEFTISPETEVEKIKGIQAFCEKTLGEFENVQMEYAVITSLKGSGWTFRVVFYVLSKDYNTFIHVNHAFFLRLLEHFEKENVFLRFT
ncbi:mechanosensitive ion channel family protein [Candidatus Similichlamydia laticola]|uniref:Potassium efflux system KefA protein n=1 Tax=Candidatus Similichlamydia laticola TaxID=2170265 RepID=A0A369KHN9_9BACT|nr:mechanosensitive ion channel domain-containing protein [Candidatus Similichlamydia laticola]RDB31313.1 Potassium efflux system KefA protein [Candidatus Similichlamydia laticola]